MAAPLARGDVVLTQFPFTDVSGAAVRPAVVISPGLIGQDLVVTAVSSVVRGAVAPTDFKLDTTHLEFALTGLRVVSVIRLHKLATVEQSVVVRRLGRIGPQVQLEVETRLRAVLGL